MRHIDGLWGIGSGAEITLEANPAPLSLEMLRGFEGVGITRLSLGVQALEAEALRFLGRRHSLAEALWAMEASKKIFPKSSFDLIYLRPSQSLAGWEAELSQALSFSPSHLSLYQLTLAPNTPFYKLHEKGRLVLPSEGEQAELYHVTQSLCEGAGLPAYEVSNHAVAGAGAEHNLHCWRGGEYIGVGPGAHGRVKKGADWYATKAISDPKQWGASIAEKGHGMEVQDLLSVEMRVQEKFLMGMRLVEGVCFAEFAEYLSVEKCEEYCRLGLLSKRKGRLSATSKGRLVLDRLLGELWV